MTLFLFEISFLFRNTGENYVCLNMYVYMKDGKGKYFSYHLFFPQMIPLGLFFVSTRVWRPILQLYCNITLCFSFCFP